MESLTVPVILDKLDDDTAAFVGAEQITVERNSPFGGTIELHGRFPVVWLHRDTWIDMGCPTSLVVTLGEVIVDDRPSI